MSKAKQNDGFEPTASVPERITALREAGFTFKRISKAAGVGGPAVKSWETGVSKPNKVNGANLNNLRSAMRLIIDQGVQPDIAAIFLQSPLTDESKNVPIDALPRNPRLVFDVIDLVFIQPADQRA
jgi:hypothetical protein